MSKELHIVCLDAPSPPDYGGAIEMHCKIKALATVGVAITLHYFDYKPERHADDLSGFCKKIYSYKRKPFFQAATFSKPHIVASRINEELIDRLNADDHPLLLEGIHCTGILPFIKNKKRNVVVRLHNDEAQYYRHLATTEPNFFKRAYYTIESGLLRLYQRNLPQVSYAALSKGDTERFKYEYGLSDVFTVPAFLPWQQVTSQPGTGFYCLYHGNLSVAENAAAARWLIKKVFSQLELPLIIAGNNVPASLVQLAAPHTHIRFEQNLNEEALTNLIEEAHVHVLPDFNKTGVKLKLLHALFEGRFCITNGSELKPSRTLAFAQTPEQYMGVLKSYYEQPFTEAHITERAETLRLYYNKVNAETLIARLYSHCQ